MRNPARFVVVAALSAISMAAVPSSARGQITGFGQSFTTPVGPNSLLVFIGVSTVGLSGSASSPFFAEIYQFNGSATVGAALFSQSLGNIFNGFSLTPNILLNAGQSYLLLARIPSGPGVTRNGTGVPNFVPQGDMITCTANACGAAFEGSADVDGFSVRYGTTLSPEPGTCAFAAAGLLALGFVARRRDRKTFV